ncbi:MAG TPA: hypothetical protein VGE37_11175 [Archangium sp.]
MAPPRKSVARGTGDLDNDPERENRTQARAQNPIAEGDDPEVNNATQARAPNPLNDKKKIRAHQPAPDPERENKTQARARAPDVADTASPAPTAARKMKLMSATPVTP